MNGVRTKILGLCVTLALLGIAVSTAHAWEWPDSSDWKIPKLPDVNVPKIEIPKIEIPKIEVPKIELPQIELPKIQLPDIGRAVREASDRVTSGIRDTVQGVTGAIKDLGNRLTSGAQNAWNGLVSAVRGGWNRLTTAISGAWSGVTSTLGNGLTLILGFAPFVGVASILSIVGAGSVRLYINRSRRQQKKRSSAVRYPPNPKHPNRQRDNREISEVRRKSPTGE